MTPARGKNIKWSRLLSLSKRKSKNILEISRENSGMPIRLPRAWLTPGEATTSGAALLLGFSRSRRLAVGRSHSHCVALNCFRWLWLSADSFVTRNSRFFFFDIYKRMRDHFALVFRHSLLCRDLELLGASDAIIGRNKSQGPRSQGALLRRQYTGNLNLIQALMHILGRR
jgi:hypothetical protein